MLKKMFWVLLILRITVIEISAQNCGNINIRCVDDNPGPNREYPTLQAAADATRPGDTVFVFNGDYAGFQISISGSAGLPITYRGQSADVNIISPCPTGDGIRLQNVDYVTIEGFKITGSTDKCIAARGALATAPMTHLIIRNNTCLNSAHEGIYISEVSNSLIEHNTIIGVSSGAYYRNHGIYLANAGSDNTTLRGNVISRNLGREANGIHINGDLSVGGDGIISGLIIENNIITQSGQNGLNMDGVQSATIQNNLIYNNARHGIRAYRMDAAEGPKEIVIVNNTLLVPVGSSGWPFKISEDGGGHVIFNNILLSEGTNGGGFVVGNPSFISNYNIVSGRFSADEEGSVLTLAGWRAQGHDSASEISSVALLFVDPVAADYHLKPSATCAIGKGAVTLASARAPAYDLEACSRPWSGGVGIGAYEFSANTAATSPDRFLGPKVLFSPLPADRTLAVRIESPMDKPALISMCDIAGKVRLSQKAFTGEQRISVSNLPNGIYFVKVEEENGSVINKVIVRH